MRKIVALVLMIILTFITAACSSGGVSRDEYDRLQSEVDRLKESDDGESGNLPNVTGGNSSADVSAGLHVMTAGRDDYYGSLTTASGWQDIIELSVSLDNIIGLKSDGTVVVTGLIMDYISYSDDFIDGGNPFDDWNDIVSVSASHGDTHIVGLKSDGTVMAVGNSNRGGIINDDSEIFGWTDIIAVATGHNYSIGLKSDGTVVAERHFTESQIESGNFSGFKPDGSSSSNDYKEYGQCDVSDWRDIIAIDSGHAHTVGLKSDGTVISVGQNIAGECDVSDWRDIIAITAGDFHTVGLKSDGSVVAAGQQFNYNNAWNNIPYYGVSDWHDIVAVSAGMSHTVGLKSDGTVVSTGLNNNGQLAIAYCRDVSAIAAGGFRSLVLTSDSSSVPPPPPSAPSVDYITIKGQDYQAHQTDLWLGYELELTNADIEPLRHMTNLTELTIFANQISDISPLMSLTNLTELTLIFDQGNVASNLDLSPLSEMAMLMKLTIHANKIEDLSPLKELVMMYELDLAHNIEYVIVGDYGFIEDISALSGMSRLSKLDLFGQSITDLSPISSLRELNALELSGSLYNTKDLSPLSALSELTILSLVNNKLDDISALASLSNLCELDLFGNELSNISALSELTNLVRLNLGGNPIGDISSLAGLMQLEVLIIDNLHRGNDKLRDISPLAELVNLTNLNLNGNYQIGDISALAGLVNMRSLDLMECGISDISALSNMRNLELASLYNMSVKPGETAPPWYGSNNITDWSPVAHVPNVEGRP